PRTRSDASLIRFGREGARIALTGDRAGSPLELNVILHAGSAKRASLNGARLQAAEQLRSEVATLVFTPDRLVVVKGGPAARLASTATWSAEQQGSDHTSTTLRSSPEIAISGRSARRVSRGWRCSPCFWPRPTSSRIGAAFRRCSCSTTCCRSSTPTAGGFLP